MRVSPGCEFRLAEALELAISHGMGMALVEIKKADGSVTERLFNTKLSCPEHGVGIGELEPRMFSFNSPISGINYCNDYDILLKRKCYE